MYKKTASVLILSTILLAACSKEEPKAALDCAQPATLQNIRTTIEDTLKQQARSFARNDNRQFVDADKIIAAGLELETLLEDPKETEDNGKAICRANLKIRIPDTILKTAIDNSPLIYGNTPLSDMLEQKLMGSNLTFENNTFSTTLLYTPDKDGKPVFEDNTLSSTAQTLSATLLPYGVKSIVMIDGKPVSKRAGHQTAAKPKTRKSRPPINPQDILENNAASQAVGLTDDDDDSDTKSCTLTVKLRATSRPASAKVN